jgi:NAD(P)-dependent dehydrogenase (short-subunit alcohol dehydrogenase family)
MGRLQGKVALITGGASGIGRATGQLFAMEGAKVVIGDVKEKQGGELADTITNGAMFVKLDVTREEGWKRSIELTLKRFGKLDVLVNNAGISLAKDIEETTLDDWNHIMNVNATGVFLGTKFAIQAMKKNKEGSCSIINRSSIDGQVAEPGLFAYCASKGAVRLLTKSAALLCGQRGYKIRVNSVHPGYIHTELTEHEARGYGLDPEEYFIKVGAQHPIGHIGEPLDVAYMDLYLASDESKWVTGAEFVVDGGWTAQ